MLHACITIYRVCKSKTCACLFCCQGELDNPLNMGISARENPLWQGWSSNIHKQSQPIIMRIPDAVPIGSMCSGICIPTCWLTFNGKSRQPKYMDPMGAKILEIICSLRFGGEQKTNEVVDDGWNHHSLSIPSLVRWRWTNHPGIMGLAARMVEKWMLSKQQ